MLRHWLGISAPVPVSDEVVHSIKARWKVCNHPAQRYHDTLMPCGTCYAHQGKRGPFRVAKRRARMEWYAREDLSQPRLDFAEYEVRRAVYDGESCWLWLEKER